MARLHLPLSEGRPVWGAVARDGALPALQGWQHCDVAVVGAGLSGLALALALHEQGLRPVVLEADHVGAGSTPASTALLLWETDRDLRHLVRDLGSETAARVWRGCLDTLDWWDDCCRRERIGGFERARSVYFGANDGDRDGLRAEAEARHAAGLPSRYVEDAAPWLGFSTEGALVSEGAASADPARLLGDLLRSCADAGIAVHEGSRVLSASANEVRTRRGGLRARHVAVTAGLRTLPDFGLPSLVRERMTYVLAVRGTPEGWSKDVVAWSTERPYPYLRRTEDFVLLGGEDRPPSRAAEAGTLPYDRLRSRLAQWYPSLAEAPVVARWAGSFPNSVDSLPYIGQPEALRGAHALLAFGGNGLVFGLMGAWLLARSLAGEDVPGLATYSFQRPRMPSAEEAGQ